MIGEPLLGIVRVKELSFTPVRRKIVSCNISTVERVLKRTLKCRGSAPPVSRPRISTEGQTSILRHRNVTHWSSRQYIELRSGAEMAS